MEESPYVPNSIPPGLVVFGNSSYGDALRLQRPFSSQVSGGKQLNLSNISAGSTAFGLRPMDSYGGLSSRLVHLQNPFLHPALDTRLPFGSPVGAFRPVVTSSASSAGSQNMTNVSEDRKNLTSAFTPPSNRRKFESMCGGGESNVERHGNHGHPIVPFSSASVPSSISQSAAMNHGDKHVNGQRHGSRSPVNSNKDDRTEDPHNHSDRDENGTPNSDLLSDRSSPEESNNHHLPSKRKRIAGQEIACPVCKLSLRPHEMETHLLSEVEQLMCFSRITRASQSLRLDEPSTSSQDSPSAASNKKEHSSEVTQDSRWETYHRVRTNRHSRLRLKTRRRRDESGGNHVNCPVCQIPLQGSSEQVSSHIEMCLRKNGDMLDEDEPVDIEGDGENLDLDDCDYYSQRRSRHYNHHTSYPGAALNMTTNSRRRDNEENDSLEVVVDGDDTSTYGQAQYTESDVQAAMRENPSNSPRSTPPQENKIWNESESDDFNGLDVQNLDSSVKTVLKSLKSRVRELEKDLKPSSSLAQHASQCLICMDKYKKAVVSISCWHVHCEKCWLRTLGAKKLCPQCNMITSPGDLRRVFL